MILKIINPIFLLVLFYSLLPLNVSAQEEATDASNSMDEPAISTAPAIQYEEGPLDKTIPASQKAWLTIGSQTQLAFYVSETTGKANGGVLLIPKLNQHPATKGLLNNLRYALADNHWHTLSVNMTDADPQQAMNIIAAGIQYLNAQGVYNIALLGEGLGAAQALAYASTLPPIDPAESSFNQIRAVILVNADNRFPGSDADTLSTLSQIDLPILDAYSNSNYQQQQLAKARKRAANKAMKTPYQQARLPLVSTQQQAGDNRITKRIRGWLDQNVAGFMVDGQ